MGGLRALQGVLALCALVAAPVEVEAQLELRSSDATVRLGGQLDMHYISPSPESAPETFRVRRVWFVAQASYTDFLYGQVVYDFRTGGGVLLDAFARMNFDPAFRLSFGRFKRSFDIFLLNPIGDIPFLERAGGVPGYQECSGVGSVCSYGRLSERLLFSNRDTGIRADGTIGSFGYSASLTNGTLVGAVDGNDAKSLATRIHWNLREGVQFGFNATRKDYLNPSDETEYAVAWGPDLTIGSWRSGLHVQAGYLHGENWLSYSTTTGAEGPGTFQTGQLQATYFFGVERGRIEGIEPLFRLSVTDPDDSLADDGGVLVTPGLALYFLGRNRIALNLDHYRPATGEGVFALRAGVLLYY